MKNIKSTLGSCVYQSRQALRWQWFRLNCPLTRAALRQMPTGELIYSFNISSRHRYVYVGNPKTGGSSLKSALVELEIHGSTSILDCYDLNTFRDRTLSPLKTLEKLPTHAPLTYLVENGYRFITLVRNPYARLLSCYRDKIVKSEHQKAKILRLLGHDPGNLQRPVGFEEFAKAVIGQSDYEMDPHWRAQSSQILHGLIPYTFIGRFEHYQSDFAKVFQSIGINEAETPPLRHLHRTKSGTTEGCRDFYTPALQAMVHDRYKQDFEEFGYAHDLPD